MSGTYFECFVCLSGVSNLHHRGAGHGGSWDSVEHCSVLASLLRGRSHHHGALAPRSQGEPGDDTGLETLHSLQPGQAGHQVCRTISGCYDCVSCVRSVAVNMILGNLVLVQCQGIVVGFLASIVGMMMAWIPEQHKVNTDHALLLMASAMVTASIASLVLGLIMVMVILLARRFKCDPDNVATPIAASLGDVTTLGLLAWISNLLYTHMIHGSHTALIIIIVYFTVLPLLLYLSYKNEHTCLVLCTGWTPVLLAMLISSGGGMILEKAVEHFKGIAMFSPVMNGAGGNLVAIQASRMTTYLNKATNSLFGVFPPDDDSICVLPCSALCAGVSHCAGAGASLNNARMSRVLILLAIPGHLIFISATCAIKTLGVPSPLFVLLYLLAALAQVHHECVYCVTAVKYLLTWSVTFDEQLTLIADLQSQHQYLLVSN